MLRHRLAIVLSALLLSSCVPNFGLKYPLSDPDKAKTDEQLFGVWRADEAKPNELFFLIIGKSGHRGVPRGIMKLILAGINSENDAYAEELLYLFTVSVGNNSYAHLFDRSVVLDRAKLPSWDKRNIKMYMLFKYKVEGDKLTVWDMSRDAAEAAIQKGQLKGTIEEVKTNERKWEGKWGKLEAAISTKVTTLTDADGVSKFLADGGNKILFPESNKGIFLRVKNEKPR
jgi:hypothetical protein